MESNESEITNVQIKGIIENIFPKKNLPNTEYSFEVLAQKLIVKSGCEYFEIAFIGKDIELINNAKVGQSVIISGHLIGKLWNSSSGLQKYFTNISGKKIDIIKNPSKTSLTIENEQKKIKTEDSNDITIKEVINYYEDGKIASKSKLINGKLEGEWIGYFASGNIDTKRNYVNGKIDGWSASFFESGQIRSKRFYINGKKTGESISYFENGQIKIIVNQIDGKREGSEIQYYENGQIRSIRNFNKDIENGEWIQYYETGQIMSKAIYINGKCDGERELYSKSGNKVNRID